jgi:hypothetical protein
VALVGDLLFPAAEYRRTTWSLLMWWEQRRLPFNLIVGATGIVTLVFTGAISVIPPGVRVILDWRPIVAYGVLANVCYTFGWGIEAVAQRIWKERCPAIGPALFRQGLAFSVGLTLLPILLVSLSWVARVAMLLFGRSGA